MMAQRPAPCSAARRPMPIEPDLRSAPQGQHLSAPATQAEVADAGRW